MDWQYAVVHLNRRNHRELLCSANDDFSFYMSLISKLKIDLKGEFTGRFCLTLNSSPKKTLHEVVCYG
jgi:hypothetical protein